MPTNFLVLDSARRCNKLPLIRNQQPRDGGTGQSTQRPRNHGADGHAGHISTTTGRDLRKDTNLVAQGADVGKSAQSVGRDEPGADGEVGEFLVVLEAVVGDEFILFVYQTFISNVHKN